MFRFLTKILIALAVFMATADVKAGAGEAEQSVLAATEEWVATFNTRDPVRIAALYAPDAVFWGTVSPTIRTTPSRSSSTSPHRPSAARL